jgi:hypothetical protein
MKTRTLVIVAVILFAPALRAFAWGPFVHWNVSPNVTLMPYQNLPDLWQSYDPTWGEVWIGAETSAYFAWSHACQRTGVSTTTVPVPIALGVGLYTITIPVDVVYPNTPTHYGSPNGVEKVEYDIYQIWKNKVLPANATNAMKYTAQGFAGHNAEDGVVHFTYFLGGDPYSWLVGHALKESWWAEYVAYCHLDGDWDYLGNQTQVYNMSCTGDAGSICLAQKVFRKNRQTVDSVPSMAGVFESITVQTKAQITALISTKNNRMATQDSTFSDTTYEALQVVAATLGWSDTACVGLYNTAKQNAAGAVAAMP